MPRIRSRNALQAESKFSFIPKSSSSIGTVTPDSESVSFNRQTFSVTRSFVNFLEAVLRWVNWGNGGSRSHCRRRLQRGQNLFLPAAGPRHKNPPDPTVLDGWTTRIRPTHIEFDAGCSVRTRRIGAAPVSTKGPLGGTGRVQERPGSRPHLPSFRTWQGAPFPRLTGEGDGIKACEKT